VTEAFRHCKAIVATSEGVELLRLCPGLLDSKSRGNGAGNGDAAAGQGVIVSRAGADAMLIRRFLDAIAAHRFWNRARKNRLGGAADDDTRGRAPIPQDRTDEGRRLQP
jgi:catalase